jgi:hypothetical protein
MSLVIQLSTVEWLKTQVSLWRILWWIFRKKEIMHCSSKIFDTAFTGIISLEIAYYIREDGSDTSRFISCLNYLLATSQCRKVFVSASYLNTKPTSRNRILLGEIFTQLDNYSLSMETECMSPCTMTRANLFCGSVTTFVLKCWRR